MTPSCLGFSRGTCLVARKPDALSLRLERISIEPFERQISGLIVEGTLLNPPARMGNDKWMRQKLHDQNLCLRTTGVKQNALAKRTPPGMFMCIHRHIAGDVGVLHIPICITSTVFRWLLLLAWRVVCAIARSWVHGRFARDLALRKESIPEGPRSRRSWAFFCSGSKI